MRSSKFVYSIVFILLTAVVTLSMNQSNPAARAADAAGDTKLLRHVVLFKFKDSSSERDIQRVVDEFGKLKGKIPEIYGYEFGTNNSPEELNDGFTHCFLVTFKSEADRKVYLPHKEHLAFVDILKPHLDKVLVIDYWTK